MCRHHPVLIILSSLIAFGAQAEMYSWKDTDCKMHYGDHPPASRQQDAHKIIVPEPVDAEQSRKIFHASQMSEREQQQKAQENAQKQAQAKEREENCQQARANLKAIESGQVGATINTKGARVTLEGAARNAEIARARQAINAWCKSPGQ